MPHGKLVDTTGLAGELEDLARDPALALRQDELRGLAQDLKTGTDLGQWAEVDLVAAFARPESLAGQPPPPRPPRAAGLVRGVRSSPRDAPRLLREWLRARSGWDGPLEAALGILVFVPLLVTWYGLWSASQAYAELSADDPEQATRPFLQLWQSGFDERLSPVERFGSVALMAALLIMVIVVVAVLHALARSRGERARRREEQAGELLMGRLVSVLTRTQLALVPYRAASPQQFTASLSRAAGRLDGLVSKAADGQRALARAIGTVQQATSDMKDASRRLTDVTGPLSAATDRMETTLRAGQDATSRISTANVTEMQQVGQRIETALAELTGVQRRLADSTEHAVAATDRASQAMEHSSARTDDAVNGMRKAADRWDAAAAHWESAAARVDSGVRELAAGAGG